MVYQNSINILECTASVVVYNNPPAMIRKAVDGLLANSPYIELHIVDNSEKNELQSYLSDLPIIYHFDGCNVGYGRGHNKVIRACSDSKYHIIINPDVIIAPGTITALCSFMNKNPDIGIVCPKILNDDRTTQFLNKRYPTVFDLFIRRFVPHFINRFVQRRLDYFEMKDIGYDDICDVEFMSGSFMFCRTSVLKSIGGFDERYFMYLEDADLSRKIQDTGYRTVFYPHATITHLWERSSYKKLKMTWIHILSAFAYFNKWGWKFY